MGGLLMTALPSMAATQKETYTLTEASYPLIINGVAYGGGKLPVLNYKGSTYVPLRSVGDLLGASVAWDESLRRVKITSSALPLSCNDAFCNISVNGTDGRYIVSGVARVFEAVMNYAVEDGHRYLLEGHHMLAEGAPTWSPFAVELVIPQAQLPVNGTLTLELFQYSANDGSRVNVMSVPIETFGP
jgi:hypothetical protein